MRILAFECSAKAASVCLAENGQLVSQYFQASALTHSRTLLKMGEDLLNNLELGIKDVDACAVSIGPGSFTGIRIGIAAVKGLCWGADKPAIGVSTLEAMAMEYAQLKGDDGGMDLSKITEIGRYFEDKIGYTIDPRTPFVGSAFNMTRAGIHADGMMKDEEIYNIFDTKKILGRPAGILLGEHSGAAGIAYWINTHFVLEKERAIDKRDPLVEKVKSLMDMEYEKGRNTLFSNKEMEAFVREADPEMYEKLKQH